MPSERCEECGFDSDEWTDESALDAISGLADRWDAVVAGLAGEALHRRPIPDMWSIGEYVDHVREVLFGMRFVLDSAVQSPGIDLGPPPEIPFDPEPRAVDVAVALAGVRREAEALRSRLTELTALEWSATAIVGGDALDAHWIARHAVHDASHHLADVARLKQALA